MTTGFTSVTHADIQRWVGPASFQKGMSYFSQGAIFETRLQGQTLKARCRGSQASSYNLQVTFSPSGITSASCSCPVGGGGGCKHVAALLRTWVDAPSSFKKMDDVVASLEKRSKAELIALIQHMIQREPDLEMLIEIPLPGFDTGEKVLDEQVIRQQANHAFRSPKGDWEMGWGDPYEIVGELQSLFNLGEQYLAQNSPANAATIYRIVVETVLEYEEAIMQDEAGRLGGVIDDCAKGLEECLVSITDADQREYILQVLFDCLTWDFKAGGIGVGDGIPDILLGRATSRELQMISEWIRATLPKLNGWACQSMGGLLLRLQADSMDDESFLAVCRQTGRIKDLVERLLTLTRVDEAVREAQQASDYDLLSLADLFVQHDHGPLVETLISERAKTSHDTRLIEWLKEYAKKRGDLVQALAFAEKLFWFRPTLGAYVEMRQLAQPQQQWADLREKTLKSLLQKDQHDLLTEVSLDEKEIDLALASLDRAKSANRYWGASELQVKVAQAASAQRPKESIRLYTQLAESLIGRRGRENYAQATDYLRLVKAIYLRIGESRSWQAQIDNLREQHRNLPALKDELKRVGL